MGHSAGDRNLIAQLETIFSVTPGELGKDRGLEVRVSDDLGGEGTPIVIGAVQKGLDDALGEAMKERKEEEGDGDPVESYPQVNGFHYGPYPMGPKHVGGRDGARNRPAGIERNEMQR